MSCDISSTIPRLVGKYHKTTVKWYLAGPMTGYPNDNIPAFLEAKKFLERKGLNIDLPYDLERQGPADEDSWNYCIPKDIEILLKCDGIILLPGWKHSRGAKLEAYTALVTGKAIAEYSHIDEDFVQLQTLNKKNILEVLVA